MVCFVTSGHPVHVAERADEERKIRIRPADDRKLHDRVNGNLIRMDMGILGVSHWLLAKNRSIQRGALVVGRNQHGRVGELLYEFLLISRISRLR